MKMGCRIRTHSQHAITLEWKLHWKQVVEQTEKYCLNTCMYTLSSKMKKPKHGCVT